MMFGIVRAQTDNVIDVRIYDGWQFRIENFDGCYFVIRTIKISNNVFWLHVYSMASHMATGRDEFCAVHKWNCVWVTLAGSVDHLCVCLFVCVSRCRHIFAWLFMVCDRVKVTYSHKKKEFAKYFSNKSCKFGIIWIWIWMAHICKSLWQLLFYAQVKCANGILV